MTLLDLMVFYRRAARAKRAYERLCSRLKMIDLILMRLADVGRTEPADGPWSKAKMRVIQIALARRHEMEALRFEARDRASFDLWAEKEIELRLEGVRKYAMGRKRGMS
jgi:hypothetical protein